MSDNMQLHGIITGRVQGVGFRFFVIRCARRLGLTGWVRNAANGGVEVVAEGSPEALSELLAELQQGPPGGWVRDVQAQWRAATGAYEDFYVVPTSYS